MFFVFFKIVINNKGKGGGGGLEGAEQEERKKKWGEGEGRPWFIYASMAVVVDDDLWFNEINVLK